MFEFMQEYVMSNEIKIPYISRVEFEDIGSDLRSDVKLKKTKDVNFSPPIYNQCKRRANVLNVVSFCAAADSPDGESIWTVFSNRNILILNSSCEILSGASRIFRASHSFGISVIDKSDFGYLQLMCNAKKVKCEGRFYKEGDILTVFVNCNDRPMMSVHPKHDLTFMPMFVGQLLQVISESPRIDLLTDAVKELDRIKIPADRTRRIGSNVFCHFFQYLHGDDHVLLVKSPLERTRAVCIPPIRDGYAVINPDRSCVLRTDNINGFILGGKKAVNIVVNKDCPLSLLCTIETQSYAETRVKLLRDCGRILLEKQENNWFAKTL